MNEIFRIVGNSTLGIFNEIGRFTLFFFSAFTNVSIKNFPLKIFLEQLINMAIRSLPLIGMTAIFTGAVLALQSYTGFSRMHAESSIASVVVISIVRELGPVLSGLMFAGRLGASITAEIGSMRVTEQIDALDMLGVNTKSYIVLPRVLAGLVALPLLVIFADIIGVFGGYLVATCSLGFEGMTYMHKTIDFMEIYDVVSGLIKALFFGITICTVGCYNGYKTAGGAQGVGISTTASVVTGSIAVLTLNYVITGLLFSK
jgi:phospholipid/cholesterol/gamma-HCH transport system permease protein